jgi:hypothetical protein
LTDTVEVPVDPENPDEGGKVQVKVVHTWFGSGGFGSFNFGQKWLEGVYTVYDSAWFFIFALICYMLISCFFLFPFNV